MFGNAIGKQPPQLFGAGQCQHTLEEMPGLRIGDQMITEGQR